MTCNKEIKFLDFYKNITANMNITLTAKSKSFHILFLKSCSTNSNINANFYTFNVYH